MQSPRYVIETDFEIKPNMIRFSDLHSVILKSKLAMVPQRVLEPAREVGTDLMKILQRVFNDKLKLSEACLHMNLNAINKAKSLLTGLIEHNGKVKAVEKPISRGNLCGHVDMIVKDNEDKFAIVEIKTRSQNEIRNTDIAQIYGYYELVNNPYFRNYIVVIDNGDNIYANKIDKQEFLPISKAYKGAFKWLNYFDVRKGF